MTLHSEMTEREPSSSTGCVRLALVITNLNVGGAERCLVELATRIDRQRFEPEVYSLGPRPLGEQSILVERLEEAGIRVNFVDVRHGWQLPLAVSRLRRMLRVQSPDVVQSFLFHANMVAALALGRASSVQLFGGLRASEPHPRRWAMQRWLGARFEQFVCVSQSVAAYAGSVGRLAPGQLTVIPNGIDAARWSDVVPRETAALGPLAGRRIMVCVGRLEPQKAIDWLLRHAPPLLAELPGWGLLIVGDGSQRGVLERLVEDQGLTDSVHFTGFVPHVGPYLAAGDMLLFPSNWEGMPQAVMEAMALGKPVVSRDVDGVRELLGPQAAAQIVAGDDPESFHSQVVEMARNPVEFARLGIANQERILANFAIDSMVGAYQQLYQPTSI